MKLFLDDERLTPSGYERRYTAGETIKLLFDNLATADCKLISLDHDLGESDHEIWSWIRQASLAGNLRQATQNFLEKLISGEVSDPGTGNDVALWIALAARDLNLPRIEWTIHSANPIGRKNMEQNLVDANTIWSQMDN